MVRLLVVSACLIGLMGCSSTNLYMQKNTNEFNGVTKRLIGTWEVKDYTRDGGTNVVPGGKFSKAVAEYDFNSGNATYSFWASETSIAEKLRDWKAKSPDLVVTEYKINVTSPWRVEEDGKTVVLGNRTHNIVIKGSGKSFTDFYQWERSKFEAGKNVGSDGGLAGLAANLVAKSVSKTDDLFIETARISKVQFGNNEVTLCGISLPDTVNCTEKLKLSKTE